MPRYKKRGKLPITPFFCFSYDALEIVHSVQNKMLRINQHPSLSHYWNPQSWTIVGHTCTMGKVSGIQEIFDKYIKKSDCVIFVIVNRIGKYLKGEWNLSFKAKKDVHILYQYSEDIDIVTKIKQHFKGSENYTSFTQFTNVSEINEYCNVEILLPILEKLRDQDRRSVHRKNVSTKTIETIKRRSKDILELLDTLQIPRTNVIRADFVDIHNAASLSAYQKVYSIRTRYNKLNIGTLENAINGSVHNIGTPND